MPVAAQQPRAREKGHALSARPAPICHAHAAAALLIERRHHQEHQDHQDVLKQGDAQTGARARDCSAGRDPGTTSSPPPWNSAPPRCPARCCPPAGNPNAAATSTGDHRGDRPPACRRRSAPCATDAAVPLSENSIPSVNISSTTPISARLSITGSPRAGAREPQQPDVADQHAAQQIADQQALPKRTSTSETSTASTSTSVSSANSGEMFATPAARIIPPALHRRQFPAKSTPPQSIKILGLSATRCYVADACE